MDKLIHLFITIVVSSRKLIFDLCSINVTNIVSFDAVYKEQWKLKAGQKNSTKMHSWGEQERLDLFIST